MALINLDSVDFWYDSPYVSVFENLNLNIDTIWKTGLIGRNGRGKSTFLKLLSKSIVPNKGNVSVPISTSYFPFSPNNEIENTFQVIKQSIAPFRDLERQMESLLGEPNESNIRKYGDITEKYKEYGGYEIDAAILKEAVNIGLSENVLEQPFDKLSGGEKTLSLICALFLRKDQYLMLDEPTNHLDLKSRELLSNYLNDKQGFLLVSHDRYFLDSCIDHIIAINRNEIQLIKGNYSIWKEQIDLQNEFEQRSYDNIKRELSSMKRASEQRRVWADRKEKEKKGCVDKGYIGHKAAKQMKRVLVIERRIQERIEEKQKLLLNIEKKRNLKLESAGKSPEMLLTVQNIVIKYGQRTIIDDLSLTVYKGQRIAVLGSNGCGKTTLFNAISGSIKIQTGIIHRPSHVQIIRTYQEPVWKSGYLSEYLKNENIDEMRFRQILGVLDVGGEIFDRQLETFSQGQLKKVDLCRSFLFPAHLLLWDEPMNYIDIMSREQIEEVIFTYEPTMLFIEHDQCFVNNIATDIIEL